MAVDQRMNSIYIHGVSRGIGNQDRFIAHIPVGVLRGGVSYEPGTNDTELVDYGFDAVSDLDGN
jgi:hypothetical protein